MGDCKACEEHKQNYLNTREQRDYLAERLGEYQKALWLLLQEVEVECSATLKAKELLTHLYPAS